MDDTPAPAESPHPVDRWIPWMIVGVFVVLAVVLFSFVDTAFKSFNGVVTSRPFEKGLAYNSELAARERQARSGFNAVLAVEPAGRAQARVSLTVTDSRGRTRLPERSTLRFVRPTQAGLDTAVALKASTDRLTGVASLPAAGVWDVVAEVVVGGIPLQVTKRVVL